MSVRWFATTALVELRLLCRDLELGDEFSGAERAKYIGVLLKSLEQFAEEPEVLAELQKRAMERAEESKVQLFGRIDTDEDELPRRPRHGG